MPFEFNIIGMVREFETLYQDMPGYFIGQCVLPVELIFLFFQVQTVFAGLGVFRAQAAAGNVRILLVAQKTRLKSAPEVPTSEEAGLPGHEAITWFGIVAPRGTSDRIVATLNRQDHVMQDDPAVLKRLAEGGLDAPKESPAEFGARIRRDYERYREVVKSAGLKPE